MSKLDTRTAISVSSSANENTYVLESQQCEPEKTLVSAETFLSLSFFFLVSSSYDWPRLCTREESFLSVRVDVNIL